MYSDFGTSRIGKAVVSVQQVGVGYGTKMELLAAVGIGFAGVVFAIVVMRAGRRMAAPRSPLKPHFRRLGEIAPLHPCPCRTPGGSYDQCCRPRDVKQVEQDVHEFIFKDWMRRSGGRSRARPMQARLDDFPMPDVTLPPWVTTPEAFSFPIDDTELRAWTPIKAADTVDSVMPSDDVPI